MQQLVKLSAVRTAKGKPIQTVGHENRRAAVFVDEDCVDSRSDDLRTRESEQVRYEGRCSLTAL